MSPVSLPLTDTISFLPHSASGSQELLPIFHICRNGKVKNLARVTLPLFSVTQETPQGDEGQELRPQGAPGLQGEQAGKG